MGKGIALAFALMVLAAQAAFADTIAPVTTADASAGWQGFNADVTLVCVDEESGCVATKYNRDTDASSGVSLAGWVDYNPSGILFNSDGNWALDFNSIDIVGNIENTQRIFVLIDKVVPAITIHEPTGVNVTSKSVRFDVNSLGGSPIDRASITVKLNGSQSAVFSAASHCTAFGNDYNCSYMETSMDSNTNYLLNVEAKDSAGNSASASSIFSTGTLDAVPAAPTWGSASAGDGTVSLSWSANSEADLARYNIYRHTADSFAGAAKISNTTSTSYSDSGLSNGTTYYYWLTAVDAAGNESASSASKSAIPQVPTTNCSDSTVNATCSSTKPYFCNNGALESRCVSCGCASGYTCNSSTNLCTSNTCSDGTARNSCSSTKPKYCNNDWQLVYDCETCGCASGSTCNKDTSECSTLTSCEISVGMKINGAESTGWVKGGTLSVEVKATGGRMYDAALRLYVSNEGYKPNLDSGNSIYELSGEFELGSEDNRVLVELVASDEHGAACGIRQWLDVDREAPNLEVSSPKEGATIKGKYSLKATASDSKAGIKGVDFYYMEDGAWKRITGMGKNAEGIYEYLWDTANVKNSKTEIKVEAKDLAGNIAGKSIKVTIANALSAEEKTSLAMEYADANRAAAAEFISSLAEQYVLLPAGLEESRQRASELAALAEKYMEDGKYADAQRKAAEAARLYAGIAGAVSFTEYQSKEFEIGQDYKQELLGAGVSTEVAGKAAEMLQGAEVKRRMVVVLITENGRSYYQANIVVSYKNTSEEGSDVQIVEVVPKEFAMSAAELASGSAFTVVKDDPVIKFEVGAVAAGKSVDIIYGLKKELTKAEADTIIAGSGSSAFLTPFLVLGSDVAVDGSSFLQGFAVGDIVKNVLLVLGLVVVVLAVVIGAVLLRGRDSGSGKLGATLGRWSSFDANAERAKHARFAWDGD